MTCHSLVMICLVVVWKVRHNFIFLKLLIAFVSKLVWLIKHNSLPCNKVLGWSRLKPHFKCTSEANFLSLIWEKTLWEKKKMLVTSIFSFSHSVYEGFFVRWKVRIVCFRIVWLSWDAMTLSDASNCNYITHSHTMTPFDAPGKQAFENTVRKGEIARNEQFLLFPQCFLPIWIIFFHFRQIWNCRLQTLSVWKSLKFVDW